MRPGDGTVVLGDGIVGLADGRAGPGLAVGMPNQVPSKANVRMDEGPAGSGRAPKSCMRLLLLGTPQRQWSLNSHRRHDPPTVT